MKRHTITGGGGVPLHVVETGNPAGPPVVFIHGFSQSWLVWGRQLSSELAGDHRLIGLDLRGHGLSGKPRDAYGDSRLWADDIHALIRTLDLDRPVLCGWSYGPLVILDYIRHHGEDGIGGVNFIGGVTRLGGEEALSVLTADFLGLVAGFFSTNTQESVDSLTSLVRLCFTRDLSVEEAYLLLGCSLSVPSHVRQAMFSRTFDNDDLLPKLTRPVLVTHGTEDAVVKREVIEKQMRRIPTLETHLISNAGHACFWDDATAYNRRLAEFVESARAVQAR
ncbi:MAG TPA: alpha/beta hydrolase [Steroidobacteraceae bacterium]|nr:alpha/beta hydrolase [Steroidobacteraceae bacterium]